jgi:hypothetical protein
LRGAALRLVMGALLGSSTGHARTTSESSEVEKASSDAEKASSDAEKASSEVEKASGEVEKASDEARSVVMMPTPLDATVPLPEGAVEIPYVVLLIQLSAEGTVLDVKLTQGEEPYASLAQAAATRFRFTPAMKGGVPSPSRFLYEVPWHKSRSLELPPNAAPPKSEPQSTSTPSIAVARTSHRRTSTRAVHPRASTTNGVEVTVQGFRGAPGAQSLSAAEAREIPATFGDPLRAVEVLPGVTPVMAGLPYFYVRGAPPGNVGYFVDGVRVPLLWHALVGPSVIHPATLDKVTLYRGAYPASYGRYAGAIITADTVAPTPEWRGEAGIRLVDSSLMVKAPLGRLGAGLEDATAMVSGRYSYTGLAVSLLSSEVDLGYWDYQTRVTVPISRHDEISVLGLGAYDSLTTTSHSSSVQYHRVDLRYDHRFAEHGGLRVAVTAGHDNTEGDRGTVRDNLGGARLQLDRRLAPAVVLRAGVDGSVDYFNLVVNRGVRYQTASTLEALLPTRRELTAGAYAALDLFPSSTVQISPGVRADLFTTQGQRRAAVDPRLSARIRVSPKVTVEHSIGFASQASAAVPGVPAAQVMSLEGGLQRAIQASSGLSYQLASHTSVNLVVFDTIYQNLSDPLGTTHRFVYDIDEESQRVRGSAYGAEVFMHRQMHRSLGGFLSYTLSRSTRSHGRISTLSALDRTHVVNAAVALDLGKRWRLGVRGTFLSGLPIREATTAGDLYHGDERTTPFVRLDLRAEKRWVISSRYWFSAVAELMNATFSQEITERSCNPVRCTEQRVGPIVMPSIGVEAHF